MSIRKLFMLGIVLYQTSHISTFRPLVTFQICFHMQLTRLALVPASWSLTWRSNIVAQIGTQAGDKFVWIYQIKEVWPRRGGRRILMIQELLIFITQSIEIEIECLSKRRDLTIFGFRNQVWRIHKGAVPFPITLINNLPLNKHVERNVQIPPTVSLYWNVFLIKMVTHAIWSETGWFWPWLPGRCLGLLAKKCRSILEDLT